MVEGKERRNLGKHLIQDDGYPWRWGQGLERGVMGEDCRWHKMQVFVCFFFFFILAVPSKRLVRSQFPDHGLNPGCVSESAES